MKYLIVALGVLLTVSAQVLLKFTSFHEFWSKKFIIYVIASMTAYCVAFLVQSYLMRVFALSKIAPAMSIATMILVFICGVWLFNEQIFLKQTIGVLLGLISVYLILS